MTTSQTPRQPKPETQINTIKAHLMEGRTITTWDAYRLYHITCLAQCIHQLKKTGLKIQKKMVKGHKNHCAMYWLNKNDLTENK